MPGRAFRRGAVGVLFGSMQAAQQAGHEIQVAIESGPVVERILKITAMPHVEAADLKRRAPLETSGRTTLESAAEAVPTHQPFSLPGLPLATAADGGNDSRPVMLPPTRGEASASSPAKPAETQTGSSERVPKHNRAWLAVGCALVVAVVAVAALRLSAGSEDQAQVVGGSGSSDGWVRLNYRDATTVAIPSAWERQDSGSCVQAVEHWGPVTSARCGNRPGVTFLDSETFDAAAEPEVVTRGLDEDGPAWFGYVRLDDLVVGVGDDDRAAVLRVIESVEPKTPSSAR